MGYLREMCKPLQPSGKCSVSILVLSRVSEKKDAECNTSNACKKTEMSSAVALDAGRPGSIWRIYLRTKLNHLLGGKQFVK